MKKSGGGGGEGGGGEGGGGSGGGSGRNCSYKATRRDRRYLKKWKEGKSIGFTMTSSLKAKGLIPRANGTRRVSAKYLCQRT